MKKLAILALLFGGINANENPSELHLQTPIESKNEIVSKSGFFLGVEGSIGGAKVEIFAPSNPQSNKQSKIGEGSSTTFDSGILIGYQHYFGEKQNHGIKVSSHFYTGIALSPSITFKDSNSSLSSLINSVSQNLINIQMTKFEPIKAGFDISYLWDFANFGKHTFGLSIGAGYEVAYYMSLMSDLTFSSILGVLSKPKPNADILLHNLYPTIGLHYYYAHHQFELNYRFLISVDNRTYPKDALDFISTADWIKLTPCDYLNFNYTYRF